MVSRNGVVHLGDLPENNTFVKFLPKTQKSMVEKALEFFKSEDELARQLNSNQGTINDFKNNRSRSTNLKLVKNLSLLLSKKGLTEFSLEKLEKNVILVKAKVGRGIERPNFPMSFNTYEGVKIISAIFFDGGIKKNLIPFYVNNENSLIKNLISNLTKVVGDIHYYRYKKMRTNFVEFTKVLGLVLVNGLDMPSGKKVFSNPQVPEFILKGSQSVKKAFLQQAFDDEGSVSYLHKNRIRLTQYNFKKSSPKRLNQLKTMLEEFGIRVSGPYFSNKWKSREGKKTYGYQLQISNQSDIRKFFKEINFGLMTKRSKLIKLLNSYVSPPKFKKGFVPQEILKAFIQLKNENKKITNRNISQVLKRGRSDIRHYTYQMLKKHLIKVAKENQSKGGRMGSTGREFDLNT